MQQKKSPVRKIRVPDSLPCLRNLSLKAAQNIMWNRFGRQTLTKHIMFSPCNLTHCTWQLLPSNGQEIN